MQSTKLNLSLNHVTDTKDKINRHIARTVVVGVAVVVVLLTWGGID